MSSRAADLLVTATLALSACGDDTVASGPDSDAASAPAGGSGLEVAAAFYPLEFLASRLSIVAVALTSAANASATAGLAVFSKKMVVTPSCSAWSATSASRPAEGWSSGVSPVTVICSRSCPLAAFSTWARVGYVRQRVGAPSGVPATVREVVASGRLSRMRRLARSRGRR